MAFEGYLIEIGGNNEFYNKYITESTYKVAKKIIDVDSYRDANGVLHRNAVDHISYTVEFNIRPIDSDKMESIMSSIRSSFTVEKERKLNVKFWLPETGSYQTAECYMPDINYTIDHITNGKLYYKATTLKFIGY